MLSEIPVDLKKTKSGDIDKAILRIAMAAELDAINLYEEMAALASSEEVRIVLLALAKKEKNSCCNVRDNTAGCGRRIFEDLC